VNTLSKRERLKSTALMDDVFAHGMKLKSFPLMARVRESSLNQEVPFQAAFSVGKRRFRRAVDRNRIKRLMREVWRVEKTRLAKNWQPGQTQWALVFIFAGQDLPTFSDVQLHMKRLVKSLEQKMGAGQLGP
jgi:ribonuclease P protein component